MTSRRFFFPSMLIRVASAVVFSLLVYQMLVVEGEWLIGGEFCEVSDAFPDVELDQQEVAEDAERCSEGLESSFCPVIQRLHECRERDWAQVSRAKCAAKGAGEDDDIEEEEEFWLPGYCEDIEGNEMRCIQSEVEPSIWVGAEMQAACEEPETFHHYYCEIWLNDTSFSFCDTLQGERESEVESLLQESCILRECTRALPRWLSNLNGAERNGLCSCQQCSPWWLSRQCLVRAIDQATRRSARLAYAEMELEYQIADPLFVAQVFIVFMVAVVPLLWIVSSILFWCCTGQLPWAVPFDPDLHERVQAEEKRVYEELMTGSLEASRIDRFCIFLEVAFIALDVVTDLQMIWIYYSHHHYIFAAIQGLLVLRSFVEQLRYNLFAFFTEARDSVRLNLRTDALTCILQSEKTGEATLSFILQMYACFYTLSDVTTYWTTAVSLVLSVRGITKGCYIHFDLAFVSSEGLPPIVAEPDEKEDPEKPPPEDDPPKLEVSEQEAVEPPPPSRTVEAPIQEPPEPPRKLGMRVVVPV